MTTLLEIKKFLKKYWGIIAGAVVFFFYLIWKKKSEVDNLAPHIRHNDNTLSDAVDSARGKEKTAVANENKRHEKNSEEIKSEYDQKKDQLDKKTQAEAEKLFEEHKNNPEKLADELSRITGFKIILPKD